MSPQVFGTSPFAPADFEASSTMCTRCFETQSSPGCTCTHRSKFLTHSLGPKIVLTKTQQQVKKMRILGTTYVVQTAFLHSDAVYVFNRNSFQELRSEFSFENLTVLLHDPGILQRCSHFQQKCA